MSCADTATQRVIFSLGSNVGDRLAVLESACDYLADAFGGLRLSQVYETEPVGCPAGSPSYLNACVEVNTTMPAEEVLQLCMRIEKELGRTRNGVYGAPRTCDIDIILYGELQLNTPALTLPHPRAHEREFVLRPLCDIDPQLVLPGHTLSVSDMLAALPAGPAVHAFDL
ncbi:MAG: 2-amino-4-hydroxy-6-hydroxymethyldihydropteridine diphosphokinase [Akkermansia sp.]|nr:2-amino-4-hydroxy-6-hydroxymethyldihydropteridine diphosphokinase [Akkermansia sp.]